MSQELFDVLKRRREPAEMREQLGTSARDLDARVLQLVASLNGQDDSPEQQAISAYITARLYESTAETTNGSAALKFTPELGELREWWCRHIRWQQRQYLTPEVLEWARRNFNEEQFLAGLREVQATGGRGITDLLDEWEQEAASRE
ncbi:MAG TPA: hypothetical protein VH575_13850 [Gemmataceae bacterium]|jgi:hypothetical protein